MTVWSARHKHTQTIFSSIESKLYFILKFDNQNILNWLKKKKKESEIFKFKCKEETIQMRQLNFRIKEGKGIK